MKTKCISSGKILLLLLPLKLKLNYLSIAVVVGFNKTTFPPEPTLRPGFVTDLGLYIYYIYLLHLQFDTRNSRGLIPSLI
jgi:hypothetical protein